MPVATLWHVSLRAIQDWWNDNCLRLAASLAYYTALSLAPLVLLIVGIVGVVLFATEPSASGSELVPKPSARGLSWVFH